MIYIYILQRTERVMVRGMCAENLFDKKIKKELMQMLELEETTDQLAKSNSVR